MFTFSGRIIRVNCIFLDSLLALSQINAILQLNPEFKKKQQLPGSMKRKYCSLLH